MIGSYERERRQARWMIAPALAVFALVTAWPIFAATWLSLHRRILVFHESRFVGIDNYATLLADERWRGALWNTVYFTVLAVALELVIALPLALLLDRGRGPLRAAALVPWAIPTVVSAKLFAWIFNADYGLASRVIPGVDILGSPTLALHGAILVDVWKTTPFVALLLLAGLQSIPEDVRRAALVDGATVWHAFRRVTLPLLMPSIGIAVLFRALDAFRVFDAIYVMTGGGPANSTETVSIYAYKTLMRSGDFGYGSTLAVAIFLCVAALAAAWLALTRRGREAAFS